MRHLGLLIILAAPLLFGQMCGPVGPPIPPIEVTEEMRAACPKWSDSRILSEVANIAWQRETGYSYLDTLSFETAGCAISENCTPCKMAILDYVWGK